jgi:hypothetical protein
MDSANITDRGLLRHPDVAEDPIGKALGGLYRGSGLDQRGLMRVAEAPQPRLKVGLCVMLVAHEAVDRGLGPLVTTGQSHRQGLMRHEE